MDKFKNPTGCDDPVLYIRRCVRRRLRREAETEAAVNAMLKGTVLLLLWVGSLAFLVGAM